MAASQATAERPQIFGGTITIPKGCKPSVCLDRDRVPRPVLRHAYLKRRNDGLWLVATDSYLAIGIKVDGDAQEGFIPGGALRHMERGQESKQLSPTAWQVETEPYATTTYDIAEAIAGQKEYPDLENVGLWGGIDGGGFSQEIAVGINPDLMKRVADGLGARNGCRFEFFGPLRPIPVKPLGHDDRVGLQMPIRLVV